MAKILLSEGIEMEGFDTYDGIVESLYGGDIEPPEFFGKPEWDYPRNLTDSFVSALSAIENPKYIIITKK